VTVAYATIALFAAAGTAILLWPVGALTAVAAAPFVASTAVLLLALNVSSGPAAVPASDEAT
jgi:hypothetical protein